MLKINNQSVEIYKTPGSYIAVFESDCNIAEVEISADLKVKSVRPLSLNITACNCFCVETGKKVVVELDGSQPLFIFTYKKQIVNKNDYTYYFAKGVHTFKNDIVLNKGESIYLELGAILKAHIFADNANDVRIEGRGIIDTSEIGAKKHRMIKLIECDNFLIKDVTFLGAIDWTLVPIKCNGGEINGANIVTWEVNGDGIDVVGCKSISVSNCFIYATDDCVSIKATDYDDIRGCNNCENIRIEKSVFWNTKPGNAVEIGFETRCDEIKNITFFDCDVVHCEFESWESGGVFTIHNGDRAKISNITYENFRVENAEQKIFDFKVLFSRYSKDKTRGFISDILIKNIYVYGDELPPSIMRGTDNTRGIKNVVIDGLYHNDKKKNSLLSAHIITESGSSVEFL